MLLSKLDCPHCHASWTQPSEKIAHGAEALCQNCNKGFLHKKNIHFTDPLPNPPRTEDFMHEMDKEAIETLKTVKGLNSAIKLMMKHSYEKWTRMVQMSDNIKVTQRTCGYIHNMGLRAAAILDIKPPDIYINQTPLVNAYTTCVEDPIIVINSGLIELCSDEELMAVIAHEMGHIKCEHVLYHMLGNFLAATPNLFGMTNLLTGGLKLALMAWSRMSELTSDRAACMVMGDKEIVIRMLMKLAGGSRDLAGMIDYNDFVSQYDDFERLYGKFDNRLFHNLATLNRSHPFPIIRAHEINKWKGPGTQKGKMELKFKVNIPGFGKKDENVAKQIND